MSLRFTASLFMVVGILFMAPAVLAACDPQGLAACETWAEEQVAKLGCHASQPSFRNAIEDLYLAKGCRMQGVKWYNLESGAAVKGGFANGKNTDTAGCIARYTSDSYLASGGYFRTPKEALNGQFRNKSLTGCEYDSDVGKKDAAQLMAPIIGQVESCNCAGQVSGAKAPVKGGGGGGSAAGSDDCSQNKERKNGDCVCKKGFQELDDLSCAIVCPADKHFARKSKTECGCAQLYRLSDDKNECLFSPEHGFTFDQDTRDTFQDRIEKMNPNEGVFIEGALANGKKFKIGVLRLADGTFVFTRDGQHYFKEVNKAIAPSIFTRLGDNAENLWRGLKGLFGVGKYAGQGTAGAGGEDEQTDGQRRLDAALLAQKQLEESIDDPVAKNDTANEIKERWLKRAKNSVTGKWDEQFLEELKNASGLDVPTIKKVLTKDLVGLGEDVVEKLTTFPADSVVILAQELRGSSFANAVRIYIAERKAGKTPTELETNAPTELDYVSSIQGIGQQYAKSALFAAYEEAYQRYHITVQLGR